MEVLRAIMPQPMSTPTAAGHTAPFVATTLPTVAPMPRCTSGIAATCLKTNGSDAVFFSCAIASGSIRSVQTLTGTRAFKTVSIGTAGCSRLRYPRALARGLDAVPPARGLLVQDRRPSGHDPAPGGGDRVHRHRPCLRLRARLLHARLPR